MNRFLLPFFYWSCILGGAALCVLVNLAISQWHLSTAELAGIDFSVFCLFLVIVTAITRIVRWWINRVSTLLLNFFGDVFKNNWL